MRLQAATKVMPHDPDMKSAAEGVSAWLLNCGVGRGVQVLMLSHCVMGARLEL